MIQLYSSKRRKQVAYLLLSTMGLNILLPSVGYGLTGGPSQPEFSSFEPVTTNQMVDEFTGDFTYNLPILNVPGPAGSDYPLSLSYHSGASPEEEASWVGYGWTLNPGAITRNTRGFPDDYDGANVTYWSKAPKNWTATVGVGVGAELLGKDYLGANASTSLRYNNYQGYGYNVGLGVSFGKGIASLGYSATDGKSSFSASVNPVGILFQTKAKAAKKDENAAKASEAKPATEKGKLPSKPISASQISLLGGNFGLLSYAEAVRANHVSAYSGAAFNISANLQVNFLPAPFGGTANVNGSYSYQTMEESKTAPVYGYLYSSNVYNNGLRNPEAVEDYYLEKDSPYNRRDNYLGVPINNADQFSVSGEGIGGSFRLYHQEVGEFTPNRVKSSVIIGNLSPELSVGLTFGAGTDIGAGLQELTEGPWKDSHAQFSRSGIDKAAFRFANDLGGEWSAGTPSDEPVAASVNRSGASTADLPKTYPAAPRFNRSSFISYHTKADISTSPKRKYSQRAADYSLPVDISSLPGSAISEMSVVAATGMRYVYGLPLLNRNERNMHYGVVNERTDHNYLVRTNKTYNQMATISGEERNSPYAGSFLLTETRTPDYVDRTFDGPTPDDFGGYTRFNYQKSYGAGQTSWYKWRTPYAGLLYQANSLSDPLDDVGTVSYGEKEIVLLTSIQTKTHTALFYTSTRDDGRDAPADEMDARSAATPTPGNKSLNRLDQIELYANEDINVKLGSNGRPDGRLEKKPGAKPIKTVHFEYYGLNDAEALCKNVPNGTPNTTGRAGKLTLKRVYYTYEGVDTQISPYTFSYAYPATGTSSLYPSKYKSGVEDVTAGFGFQASAQNPNYSPFNLDAWGSYQNDGLARFTNQQNWVNQKPNANFDPAAWQLKVIKLPTGGEIHVQYEQDDYAYVQDKPAHVMVPLSPGGEGAIDKFVIDLNAIGISSDEDIQATKAAVDREYTNQPGRKMYFKFLYSLLGSDPPGLNPIACNSEYITGYATLAGTEINDNKQLVLKLTNAGGGNGNYILPKQVCKDFASTQRNGKLNSPGVCDPSVSGLSDQGLGPAGLMRYILQRFGSIVSLTNSCAALSPSDSYFRIPVIKAKKGGGLRVKRLMTFDTGYDGEAVLYGSEYLYQLKDPATGRTISSGVATTEPSGQREENILVDFMPRENQSLISKIVSGDDLKQAEGPIGEGLLPAPLVGYARVVTRNIHSGRTTTGYSVSEFATARQYPMQVKATELRTDNEYHVITTGLVNDQVNNLYAGQGFSFILNNMHGQPVRKATYPGNYVNQDVEKAASPSSQQRFTYYEPGKFSAGGSMQEAVPVVSPDGVLHADAHPGREVDLTMAQRSVKDTMYDLNFETDVDVTFLFFFTLGYFTVFPTLNRSNSEFATHTTSKVVRYPAILKKVETLQDGIVHTSENLAFDQYTGQPVLVRTNDEFAGGYLQQTQMASWAHPGLQDKAATEGIELTAGSQTGTIGTINSTDRVTYLQFNSSACNTLAKLTRGDLIELGDRNATLSRLVFHVDQPDLIAKRVRVYPVALPTTAQTFQSANALFPSELNNAVSVASLRILSSGRTNQLATVAGSTTYHGANLPSLAIPSILPSGTPSAFASDLTAALAQPGRNPAIGSAPVSFRMSGNYAGMNVSAFSNLIPLNLGINSASAQITNVDVTVMAGGNGQRRISIDGFDLQLPNGAGTRRIENAR